MIIVTNMFNSDYECWGYKKPLKTSHEGYKCTSGRITPIYENNTWTLKTYY